METISKLTHRRFILGQQGLWPGRRFKSLRGTASAIRTMGALQLDPLNIVARSQHIALQGRVLGYEQEFLDKVVYGQHQFFDYGGALFLYPMEELPYRRALMGRTAAYPRMVQFRAAHPAAMDKVLAALHSNGPMGNRDFGGDKLQYWSYRGRKDSAVALYYLWLLGEVMITERRGFDRVYDLRERVAPPAYQHSATVAEAEQFFALRAISLSNMIREKRFRALWQCSIERKVPQAEADRKLAEMLGGESYRAPADRRFKRERDHAGRLHAGNRGARGRPHSERVEAIRSNDGGRGLPARAAGDGQRPRQGPAVI